MKLAKKRFSSYSSCGYTICSFGLNLAIKKNFNPSANDVVIACSRKRHHPTIAMWSSSLKNKIEKSILNNVRKIDFFTKDLS